MMTESDAMDESVSVDRLLKDFKVVVQDAETLVKATAGDLGGKLEEKTAEARKRLSNSLDSAKETFKDLESKAMAGAKATDRVIREHPYESLGVAFGVGMLLGLLITRR